MYSQRDGVEEAHQRFIHAKDVWGDEHFSYLAREWRLAVVGSTPGSEATNR